jgi:hypothetical protein
LPREPATETANVFEQKKPLNGMWRIVRLHALLGRFCKTVLK